LFAIDVINSKHAAKLKATGQKVTSRDEPPWQDRNVFLKIVRRLGLSNEPSITAAVNASATTLANLPTIRNFYAHRNEDTAKKTAAVQLSYGVPGKMHLTCFLGTRLGVRPHAILRYLVKDIGTALNMACF